MGRYYDLYEIDEEIFRDTGLCCYLTRWLTPDTLKNEAMAGPMLETFVINEILKSYSNEGLDYNFDVYYYNCFDVYYCNGKDKKKKTRERARAYVFMTR